MLVLVLMLLHVGHKLRQRAPHFSQRQLQPVPCICTTILPLRVPRSSLCPAPVLAALCTSLAPQPMRALRIPTA
eukprot:1997774-Rhodomonas_salina.6